MAKREQTNEESVETTRERIVEAASQVFAERGFAHATVREIVERAGANIAAVNYHFGGKNELYSAVIHKLMAERADAHPYDGGLPPDASAKQRLEVYIRAFLRRLMLEEVGTPIGRMMTREMIEPTHALDELVLKAMSPAVVYLVQVVEQILERRLDSRERFHVVSSIIGQVVFHKHCRAVIDRMFPEQPFTSDEIDLLADHITRFTYAGILQMKGKDGENP